MKAFAIAFVIISLITACSPKGAPDREAKHNEADKGEPSRTPSENTDESRDRDRLDTDKKGEADEDEERPEEQDIGEDCVAFMRSTIVGPVKGEPGACPTCPSTDSAPEVLKFTDVKINRVTPGGASCQVAATIYATFNPSHGGVITGGLTGWISPEQRARYARGETPPGEQTYNINITYRRTATGWRPVEFN